MKNALVLILFCFSLVLHAQEKLFWKEIKAFKAADSMAMPPKNAIVFVGSSSIRMWKSAQQDFPDEVIINRGFGGSRLPQVIDYADEIIIPYKPKKVLIYCGENDFAADGATATTVVDNFKKLFVVLREALPRTEILFISMKPSPSRRHLMKEMAAANETIRKFLEKERRATFISIWDPMLDSSGEPREELFLKDMLHMNEKGYAIWKKAVGPHL